MPRALQRERTRGGAPAQYEGGVKRSKAKRRRLFTWKQRLDKRTANVRESARAIKEGRAEAHPSILEHGFPTINVPPEELRGIGRTFGESLMRSSERRLRARPRKDKKKKQVAPGGQDTFAALFGQ